MAWQLAHIFAVAALFAAASLTAAMVSEGAVTLPALPALPRLPRLNWPVLPAVSFKRVGGLRFLKIGRLSVSWSIARPR